MKDNLAMMMDKTRQIRAAYRREALHNRYTTMKNYFGQYIDKGSIKMKATNAVS